MEENILEYHINDLRKIQKVKTKYMKPGVWILYGLTKDNIWACLEVAQTSNIKEEIEQNLYIFKTQDDNTCLNCTNTYCARKRFEESKEFKIHKCKKCNHTNNLRNKSFKRNPRRIDKYKDILQNHTKLKFVCVYIDNENDDKKRKLIEKEYAKKYKPLYWWS